MPAMGKKSYQSPQGFVLRLEVHRMQEMRSLPRQRRRCESQSYSCLFLPSAECSIASESSSRGRATNLNTETMSSSALLAFCLLNRPNSCFAIDATVAGTCTVSLLHSLSLQKVNGTAQRARWVTKPRHGHQQIRMPYTHQYHRPARSSRSLYSPHQPGLERARQCASRLLAERRNRRIQIGASTRISQRRALCTRPKTPAQTLSPTLPS